MTTELIVNASLPETRIALMENGEIQEILIERAQGKGIVGNIYKGRVTRVLPGMQAAFVDIGLEKAAFLYVDDVFVHSEIWAEEEGDEEGDDEATADAPSTGIIIGNGEKIILGASAAASAGIIVGAGSGIVAKESGESMEDLSDLSEDLSEDFDDEDAEFSDEQVAQIEAQAEDAFAQHPELLSEEEAEDQMAAHLADDEEEDEDDDGEPVGMTAEGEDAPAGTISAKDDDKTEDKAAAEDDFDDAEEGEAEGEPDPNAVPGETKSEASRRRRRGRRGGRNRRRGREEGAVATITAPGEVKKIQVKTVEEGASAIEASGEAYPESYHQNILEAGETASDRATLGEESVSGSIGTDGIESNRPEGSDAPNQIRIGGAAAAGNVKTRPEFKETRARDRKIRSKQTTRPSRMNINIQDLLKEGQEVIVQIAKDPIATKGARLTCHISLPGRHLVCMPTIDHVGVSRRIERDEERRRLREYVDRNRPAGLGFIVRTATSSGKAKAEARIKQDIDYLSALWNEIKSKANAVTAPALVYEDLNPVLRAIRDWVNEDIDKIVVDSRYHYNDVQRFVRNFMPGIQSKAELYQGDIPIFDTYGISTELSRALERKVWLKSGGYLVIDQAEALVAIDVNTGRYVGKKNLEDTILKTNLEAVKEIAYQLRLRNCGGIIILDLIDMDKEENKLRVYRALEEELKKDRSRPQILKISELGLVEMTRKRTRDTMVRALCDSCPNCEGKGYIKSKLTVAYEILRDIEREGIERDSPKLLVQAHPDVIDTLAIDERESLDQLERRYKKQIYLQAVSDLHLEQFELIGDKRPNGARTEEALLERARELAQTSDPRRSRRGRTRGRDSSSTSTNTGGGSSSAGKERSGREGGSDRDQPRKTGSQSSNRNDRGDREKQGEARVNSNRPRISIRPGSANAPGSVGGEDGEPNESAVMQPDSPAGMPQDQEVVGNRISIGIKPRGAGFESAGKSASGGGEDDFSNEEDRLAYQRAQAAQDAALSSANAEVNGNKAPGQPRAAGAKWSKPGQQPGRGPRDAAGPRAPKGRNGRRGRFQRGARTDAPGATVGSSGGGISVGATPSASDSGSSDGGGSGDSGAPS